jgi:hypothetical protein
MDNTFLFQLIVLDFHDVYKISIELNESNMSNIFWHVLEWYDLLPFHDPNDCNNLI